LVSEPGASGGPLRCRLAALALAAIAAALPARPAAALEPDRRFDEVAHAAWPSVAHASTVYALLPDRDGHLWIGTSEGLVRFDGQRISTFDGHRLPGMVDQNVRSLLETADGTLWVGSLGRGLARLKGQTVSAWRGPGNARFLHRMHQTPDGTVWVATRAGVFRFLPGRTEPLATHAGLARVCSHMFVQDADDPKALWLASHGGLFRWGQDRWIPETGGGLPAALIVDALISESNGTLWAGTRSDGLWQRAGGRWRRFDREAGLGSNEVTAVLRDRAGHLWVATRNGNLAWLDGDRFRAFPLPPRICGDRIETLAEDGEGGLWIGTERCGLHRLSDRPFRTITTEDGLPSDDLLGLSLDSRGGVIVGSRGGALSRLPAAAPDARAEVLPCGPGLPCQECWDFSLGASAPGAFWAVCRGNTVLRWDGKTMSRLHPLPGKLSQASFAIEASDGALWLALDRDVVRSHGGVAIPIREQQRLLGPRILFQGQGGTIWIGAADGVLSWQAGKTRLVRLASAERPAEVANFYQDAGGTIWMATKGEGIRRLRPGGDRIDTIGTAQGLPTGWIVQLLEDGMGRLWASSSKGIFWVDRRELEEVAEGRRERVLPNVYDASDGVQMRAEPFGHPAGIKDGKGRLWFATMGGLTVVDPPRAVAPRVTIEQLRVGGQRIDLGAGRTPVVTGAPSDLDLSFSALSFQPPDTISFRYRLRRNDPEWVEIGSSRTVHHARLPAGDYQLAVQARTREGSWGQASTGLEFVLRPPFHRSPAFLVLLAMGAALLLVVAHRGRMARTRAGLQAVMAERTRIAREIHDTLAQAFVATSVQLECLEEALEGGGRSLVGQGTKIRQHLDTAKRVVDESLEEARRAVWVMRPQAIESGLVPALETLVNRVSGGTAVELKVSGAPRELPPLVASNLLRIAHEAVANAHRHARARRIDLRLEFADRSVTLAVVDDGKGLSDGAAASNGSPRPSESGVTHGILGMKERAAQMGGRLSVEGRPERGTTVRVEVAA
jgi:signal transduction histidine kinase/ligand-binding sensor domain-containing protein